MNQDELKTLVGQQALSYVLPGSILGVGTGSTVNKLIDALATKPGLLQAAVSSSEATSQRLRAIGVRVLDANQVGELSLYIDGADEIDPRGFMIKGGGAALTREKIVAAQAKRFICIADQSKLVDTLGAFAVPVEVIPMAVARVTRQFAALGGTARLRTLNGAPVITDNGQHLLDVAGLSISDPLGFETEVNQWPGVVTVGVFARQKAQLCLLATSTGVRVLEFE